MKDLMLLMLIAIGVPLAAIWFGFMATVINLTWEFFEYLGKALLQKMDSFFNQEQSHEKTKIRD